jgi:hypothetical protein
MRPNKLECLHLAKTFLSSLHLLVPPGAYPNRKHLKGPPLGLFWPCPQILRPDWKGLPRTNPLAHWASSSGKNLYNIDISGLYYKSFTIIIYNRNDNDLYYKTMIVANLSLARSVNYDCKVRCKLKRTFTIVNYDPKHL